MTGATRSCWGTKGTTGGGPRSGWGSLETAGAPGEGEGLLGDYGGPRGHLGGLLSSSLCRQARWVAEGVGGLPSMLSLS